MMRAPVPTLLLVIAVPTGCGSDVEPREVNLEHRLRWQQEPASEIQDCHVFKLGNERSVEVDRLQVEVAEGSHHVHIYRSSEPEADAVYDCFTGIDSQKWSLVLAAQRKAMDWQLPEGVTVPFAAHQQLLVQVHWLNTTNERVESTIDLSFHTTEESQEHLGGPDGQLALVWPGAELGGSHRRANGTVWARSSAPIPGTCEVLDAH